MQNKEVVWRQKLAMIAEWQQSGLSQKVYCEQNNIAYHVFHYWYKRHRVAQQGADSQPSSFVKLEVAPQGGYAHIELVLPDGKRMLFHHLVSSDYLKAIIS
jgi:hypothetical protein